MSHAIFLFVLKVMETKDMLYIVTEYAKNGEMFGELERNAAKSVDPDQMAREPPSPKLKYPPSLQTT